MTSYLTLANSIIGASVLAMPYAFQKCGIILSILLLIISTLVTRTCCNFLIKASIVTRRKNMEQLGFEIFGSSGKLIVELSVIGFLMGTCVAFFVVIGDLSPLIISKVINIQRFSHDSVRKFLIIVITLTTVVPLSIQKSIESLAFVCKASIGFYICLTLKIVFESFKMFESDEKWTTNLEIWDSAGIIQCIPIFSMAMSCQLQLFEVYETMPGSFDTIRSTVNNATLICMLLYGIVGFFGYIAFNGETLSGNILMNLRPSFANDAITFGFILSIACSFPLVIFPCRAAIMSFLHRTHLSSEFSSYVPESKYHPITFFIVFSTMILGILVPSVEVIISLVGSTIGIVVCVIFPATCFVKIMKRNSLEKRFAQMMIALGFVVMILGTYSNLMAIENANSGAHLETKIIEKLFEDHPKNIGIVHHDVPAVDIVKIENKISEDGIKKEEQEIMADKKIELKEVQKELEEKKEKIQNLLETNDHLEKKMEIVMQKVEEIVEKVEQIEKKANDEEHEIEELQKKTQVLAPVKDSVKIPTANTTQTKFTNETKEALKEASKIDIIQNVGQIDLVKPKQINNNNETIKKTFTAGFNDRESRNNEKVVVVDLIGGDDEKLSKNSTKNNQTAPNKPPIDPIVQLIKNNEALSYSVGEKMSEVRKSNLSKIDNKSDENELKNEMRKKRETIENEIESRNLHTLIGRELKSTKN